MPIFDRTCWPDELTRAEWRTSHVLPDTDEPKTIAELAAEQRAFWESVTELVDVVLGPEESELDGTPYSMFRQAQTQSQKRTRQQVSG